MLVAVLELFTREYIYDHAIVRSGQVRDGFEELQTAFWACTISVILLDFLGLAERCALKETETSHLRLPSLGPYHRL